MSISLLLIVLTQFFAVSFLFWTISSQARLVFRLDEAQGLAFGIVLLAAAGLLMFWISFFDLWWGTAAKLAFFGGVLFVAFNLIRNRPKQSLELILPCLLMGTGAIFLLVALAGADPVKLDENSWEFLVQMANTWNHALPMDNQISFVFAEEVREAKIHSPMIGDWLSSDRPPLQTGLYLLLDFSPSNAVASYQAISSAVQALVIPMSWALSRAFGADRRTALCCALMTGFSPFVILNTVFVWPKLLAAALVCAAAIIYLAPKPSALEPGQAGERPLSHYGIGGGAIAFAMLSHGTTAFITLGFGLVVLLTQRTGGWRAIAAAAVVALALYLPWTAYQRWYDPPGDRLLKWHLAGVIEVTDTSLGETLEEAYSSVSAKDWVDGRTKNLLQVIEPANIAGTLLDGSSSVEEKRHQIQSAVFLNFSAGLGVLAIGLWFLPAGLLFASTRPTTLAVGLGTILWGILMFEPGSTIPHQGSYFLWPALAAILAQIMSKLSGKGLLALTALQIGWGSFIYAFT